MSIKQRREILEASRKQLADGTWPTVMGVFGYGNPNTPRATDKEFDDLIRYFKDSGYENIAEFIELVKFQEKEHNVTLSFNLSMRHRALNENDLSKEQKAALVFSCQDILVGSRGGTESALLWFKSLHDAVSDMYQESMQVLDKIFSEGAECLKKPAKSASLADLAKAAFGDGEIPRTDITKN